MNFLTTGKLKFTECLTQVAEQYLSEVKFLAVLKLLKRTDLNITKDLTGSLLTKALAGSQLILIRRVLQILILLAWRVLWTGEIITVFLQLIILTGLQTHFFTFLHRFKLHWSERAQFLTKVKFDAVIIRSIVTQDGGSLSVTQLHF